MNSNSETYQFYPLSEMDLAYSPNAIENDIHSTESEMYMFSFSETVNTTNIANVTNTTNTANAKDLVNEILNDVDKSLQNNIVLPESSEEVISQNVTYQTTSTANNVDVKNILLPNSDFNYGDVNQDKLINITNTENTTNITNVTNTANVANTNVTDTTFVIDRENCPTCRNLVNTTTTTNEEKNKNNEYSNDKKNSIFTYTCMSIFIFILSIIGILIYYIMKKNSKIDIMHDM